jgi:hypothetical protein
MAKDKWEYHEAAWDNTKSYGNVSIGRDSVQQWGPWEDFVQPAAGGPSIGFLGAGSGDMYRPLPPIPTPIPGSDCASGAWCGYVVYTSYSNVNGYGGGYGYGEGYGGYYRNRPQAGLIELRLSPNDPSAVTVLGGSGLGTVEGRITPLAGSDPLLVIPELMRVSGGDLSLPVQFGSGTSWVSVNDGLANFYGSASGYIGSPIVIQGQTIDGGESGWYASIGGHNRIWARSGSNEQYDTTPYMTMGGNLYVSVWGYVSGDSENQGYYYNYVQATDGAEGYVAGIATSLADMAALQARSVTATYNGYTSGYKNTSGQSPVVVNVNFGNASWSGTWNNGSNGNVWYGSDSSGRPYIAGQVGVIASGTISGANFQSTSVSANDGNVTGKVQGTFYGPEAAGLGGVVNVTKTPNVSVETVARSATPVAATYVDVFAAQKVVP